MQFILASGSPRRRELLASLGIEFTVIKSDIDETQRADEDAYAYVRRLSIEKAEAVAARVSPPALILAADTVVILDGEVLGKPTDAADARSMLCRLRGRDHVVCTALTLLQPGARQTLTELTETVVSMRDYSDAEIDAYIATGDPFDKAGGYAIQHQGFHPVARSDGSTSNVVGLPLETLRRMLVEAREPTLHFRMPMDEFLALPKSDHPAELIDGVVYAQGESSAAHQEALNAILMLLVTSVGDGKLMRNPAAVYLDDLNVLQPDLLWVSPQRLQIAETEPLRGAPDLVIEVLAPTTAKRDEGVKLRLYEKYGVREYWMVNPSARDVVVWVRDGASLTWLGLFSPGESFPSAALQKMVAVSAIFGGAN